MSQHHGRTAVVVDHHPLWVAGVQRVVEELGLQVAGTATSGREGLALVTELRSLNVHWVIVLDAGEARQTIRTLVRCGASLVHGRPGRSAVFRF